MTVLNRNEVKRLLEDVCSRESVFLFDDPKLGPLTGKPVMAVASADDPFFKSFKDIIGPFHRTPREILVRQKPGSRAESVISWYLPTSQLIRETNRKEEHYPSKEWAFHRTYTGHMLERISLGMVQALLRAGYKAAAPCLDPENRMMRDERTGLVSPWSERHAAFTAGLGTFGLSGGLITGDGMAHRLGSIVTDLVLEPDERSYGDDPFAWCLGVNGGSCRACLRRCPSGSVGNSQKERDKDLCCEYTHGTVEQYWKSRVEWTGEYGCGLCQTSVPCEFRNPTNPE